MAKVSINYYIKHCLSNEYKNRFKYASISSRGDVMLHVIEPSRGEKDWIFPKSNAPLVIRDGSIMQWARVWSDSLIHLPEYIEMEVTVTEPIPYQELWQSSVIDNKNPIHYYNKDKHGEFQSFMEGWNDFERTVKYPYQGTHNGLGFEIDNEANIVWKQLDPGLVL